MRTVLRLLSVMLLMFGVPVALLGAIALADSAMVVPQPPPSLNEGPGLARFVGSLLLLAGVVASLLGIGVHFGLQSKKGEAAANETTEWKREHKRLF